jgi:hypothetical protein
VGSTIGRFTMEWRWAEGRRGAATCAERRRHSVELREEERASPRANWATWAMQDDWSARPTRPKGEEENLS